MCISLDNSVIYCHSCDCCINGLANYICLNNIPDEESGFITEVVCHTSPIIPGKEFVTSEAHIYILVD